MALLGSDQLERDILRAYVQLAVMPNQVGGVKTATLATFGSIEVRLTEITQLEDSKQYAPPFWLEVYSHATDTVLDSCGCYEFDETELTTAVDLVCEAREKAA
jgi:hypothetical protein